VKANLDGDVEVALLVLPIPTALGAQSAEMRNTSRDYFAPWVG
jgi:hypothetical protein